MKSSFQEILIVKPSSLGDILHAFPLVTALKAARPDLSVDWIANGEYADLVRRHPGVRNVWEFPRREFGRPGFFPKFGTLWHNLSGYSYDAVLDAQGLLRSALLARMARTGPNGGLRLGFGNAREGATLLYDRKVPVPETRERPLHAVARNLLFLGALGIESGPPPETLLRYGPADESVVDDLLSALGLSRGETFFVLHPGAKRESKKWPASYFSELIRKLPDGKYPRPILMGDRSELPLLEEIRDRSERPVPLMAGALPLDLVPLFLGRAAFFVGNDSGPLHMASLRGIPTLSFYGSSDPARTGPWGGGGRNRVLREALPCSPCGDFVQACSHMTCQVSLTPGRAMEELDLLLRRGEGVP